MVATSDDHQSQLHNAQTDTNVGQASSVVSMDELPTKTTLQPRTDTGWAWVVLVGVVVVNFVAFGSSALLSVYLNLWMEYFDSTAVTVGFVVSLRPLVKGMLSPVSAAICTKFGPRVTMMVGGVTLVGGYVIGTFSQTIWILIFSNGFLTAFGSNLSRVASFQILCVYFNKRFAFAVGLASVGVGIKQLVCPPLYTYLIDLYGWQGSMLIIAGVSFHVIAAGALMRPITSRKTTLGPDDEVTDDSCNTTASTEGVTANISSGNIEEVRPNNSLDAMANGVSIGSDSDTKSSSVGCVSGLKHFILETYGMRRLAKNTEFLILMIVSVCHGFGKLGLVYSVVRAESVGIEPKLASLILSLIGGGNIVIVVTHGWFIDQNYITAKMAYALGMLLYGAFISLTPAFVNFIPLAIIAVPMGMAGGMIWSLLPVIVCSHVQKRDTAGAFGALLFFWGIGEVAGVFVAGLVYDNLGSYDVAFFIGGGASLIASILTFVVYVTKRSKQRRKETATLENFTEPVNFPTNQSDARSEDNGFSNPAFVLTDNDEPVSKGNLSPGDSIWEINVG